MKNDIRQELLQLQVLQGIDFVRQLKLIVSRKEFRPLEADPEIFLVGGKDDADFPRLLDSARKAVALGYRVYMLPNPHGFRTADFIFECTEEPTLLCKLRTRAQQNRPYCA